MSAIYYNGVMLQLTNLLELRQQAIYSDDGADYLYTHFYLDCECLWNPLATADRNVGAVPITNVVSGVSPPIGGGGFTSVPNELQIAGWLPIISAVGFLPAVSIGNLRQTLLAPRGLLIVAIGNDILLISPNRLDARAVPGINVNPTTVRAPVDAKTGPNPIAADLVGFHGLKSIKMRFTIETWVNECPSAKYLLSNRWTMRHEVDPDYYLTTRIIHGTAIFRPDTLALLNLASPVTFPIPVVPDDFRRALFLPVPPNYQRRQVHVGQSSDGTTINYQIVDEEQPINLGLNNPVTRIEGEYRQGYSVPGNPNPFAAVNSIIKEGARGYETGKGLEALGAAKGTAKRGGIVGAAVGAILSFADRFSTLIDIPMYAEIDLHLWGSPGASKTSLVEAAQAIAAYYQLSPTVPGPAALLKVGVESHVNFDIKYKRIDYFYRMAVWNPQAMYGGLGAWQKSLINSPIGQKIAIREDFPTTFVRGTTSGNEPFNPNFYGRGSRGKDLASLFAAALNAPCAQPAVPATYRKALNFSLSL